VGQGIDSRRNRCSRTALRAPLESLRWKEQFIQAEPPTLAQAEYEYILKALKGVDWVVGGFLNKDDRNQSDVRETTTRRTALYWKRLIGSRRVRGEG
jgi:hypothetical protein